MWTRDRRWGDQARGCCEDLGKDVGSPHSAITYEGRTRNIRMTLGSQKWEFATMGWKGKGQHKERVPGVWGWVTSVEHRQTTKLEKKKNKKNTQWFIWTTHRKGIHHCDKWAILQIPALSLFQLLTKQIPTSQSFMTKKNKQGNQFSGIGLNNCMESHELATAQFQTILPWAFHKIRAN